MKLDLTDRQRKSLMKGKAVQLKHGQIGSGMAMSLHPVLEKRLLKAHRSGKGMRLNLSGGELDAMEGAGFFKSIKKKQLIKQQTKL